MAVNTDYETKLLSLLQYALKRRGVPEDEYFIGGEGQERAQSDKMCLLKSSSGQWIVLYTERGNISQRVGHPSIRDGIQDFFWKLSRKDTPWDFRDDWEAETGQRL